MTLTACQFNNKKFLILGLGLSGQSAAHFLLSLKTQVFGYDKNIADLKSNPQIRALNEKGLQFFDEKLNLKLFDVLVVSPGVPSSDPIYQAALKEGMEIIGETELACRHLSVPCIGVTGTNGKTTVTLLIAHVLNYHGIAAKAVGNIGVPLTSLIENFTKHPDSSLLVMELSSYQLESLSSRVLDAAVLLNITPDHLDRHLTMEKYAAAKARIFDCLKTNGKGYVTSFCLSEWKCLQNKSQLFSFNLEPQLTKKLQIHGRSPHEIENCLAAYAICKNWSITADQFLQAIESFKKPPHRIEWVRTLRGVDYIDDSKGTNIDAVIKAVESINRPIHLIAGGVDKGFPYFQWIEAFKNKVRTICAIGEAAHKMHSELSSSINIQVFTTLNEAVEFAAKIAESGDTILLSPGCSSYDMFKDYAHRGSEFKRIVNSLE